MKNTVLLLSLCCLVALLTAPCLAQPHDDAPCRYGLGAVIPPRIEPRHPDVICLPTLGEMTGSKPISTHLTTVYPVNDVDKDGLADWILTTQPDTTINGRRPNELRLYRGIRGRLPSLESGERIGPTKFGANTYFIAAGDWDDDGNVDLLTEIYVFGDTSGGNTHGYEVSRVVVWWGNINGQYTLTDTSQLNSGTDVWGGVRSGIGNFRTTNDINSLVLWTWGQGLTNGQIVNTPQVVIFRGHRGKRWGRDGVPRTADLGWWSRPSFSHFAALDQNCDGAVDLVFYNDDNGVNSIGSLSVLYGTPGGGLPDTTNLITVSLQPVAGHAALLSDISGDGVPELIVAALDEFMHVYGGEPGVRIDQQFGSGSDEPDPEHGRWYRRPWATFPLPRRLHDGWAFSGTLSPLDLGDANLDGLNDIFTRSWPFLIEYNTSRLGGEYVLLDSSIDGMYRAPNEEIDGAVRVGDIDGSGVPSIAVTFPEGVAFIKGTEDVAQTGVPRKALHGPDVRCSTINSVDDRTGQNALTLILYATPNPASGDVHLNWEAPRLNCEAHIHVHDALGREIAVLEARTGEHSSTWNAAGLPGGRYYITLSVGERTTTTAILITR